jgi:hypothetical protein
MSPKFVMVKIPDFVVNSLRAIELFLDSELLD